MSNFGYDYVMTKEMNGLLHLAAMETVRSTPHNVPFYYPKALCGIGPVYAVVRYDWMPFCRHCQDVLTGRSNRRGPQRSPVPRGAIAGHPGEPTEPYPADVIRVSDQERVRLIVERACAIVYTEWSRESHVIWRDWLLERPDYLDHDALRYASVGNLEHQERCIMQYDAILQVLRRDGHGKDA